MQVFEVFREKASDKHPVRVSQIRATKGAVREYIKGKLGTYVDRNLRRTKNGYTYELEPFNYFHFTK